VFFDGALLNLTLEISNLAANGDERCDQIDDGDRIFAFEFNP